MSGIALSISLLLCGNYLIIDLKFRYMKVILLLLFLVAFCSTKMEAVPLAIAFKNINKNYLGKTMVIGYWVDERGDCSINNQPRFKQKKIIDSYPSNTPKQLTQGEHALSIAINGNGPLDKNFLGTPTAPCCFSPNYKPPFSSPNFENWSIVLQTTIKLKFIN